MDPFYVRAICKKCVFRAVAKRLHRPAIPARACEEEGEEIVRLLAIDPGPKESAWLWMQDGEIRCFAKEDNEDFLLRLRNKIGADVLAVEMIESFGMAVGAEVFQTCVWLGRFIETWNVKGFPWHPVTRKEVKMHLCQSMRAKDGNIRQAIIDRYGGSAAIGRKKSPGPLFGVSGDVWSALAVAITWSETHGKAVQP